MEVRSIADYKAEHPEKRPRVVSFHSGNYTDNDGKVMNMVIRVAVKNGNVEALFESVQCAGGIGHMEDDGTFVYIPWPPAVIEVREALSVVSNEGIHG